MDPIFRNNPYLFEYFGLVLSLILLFGATFYSEKIRKLRDGLGVALIFTPVLYFYLILDAHLLNIPFSDDYNLLETIYNFRKEPDFISAVKILFEQVNQHRFPFERTVMLIMVFFSGTVNIKLQTILGNLFMLGILYFFFLVFKKDRISWYCFIPVPYVLFNLVYFENAFWGIAAIQNTPLIFFAFLSAYVVSRVSKRSFVLGILTAFITTFVSGSGLLAWVVGAIILAFQKRFRSLAIWLIVAAGIFMFYFLFDYTFIQSQGIRIADHKIFNAILLFGFWGNGFYLDIPHPLNSSFYPDLIMCVLLGMAIGGIFLFWVFRIFTSKNLQPVDWFLLGAFMFVMGTGAMFVLSRPINNFVMYGGNIFSRRYMIFGVVIMATTYIATVILTKEYKYLNLVVTSVGMATFLALNFVSYYTSIPQLLEQNKKLGLDVFYWKNYSTFLTTGDRFGDVPFWNHPTRMKNLIKNLQTGGLIKLYESDQFPATEQIIPGEAQSESYKSKLDVTVGSRVNYNNVSAKYIVFKTAEYGKVKPSYFVLASGEYTLLLPALPVANSVPDFLTSRTYYSNKFQYAMYSEKLPAGKYKIWVMSQDNLLKSQWKSRYTGKEVIIL